MLRYMDISFGPLRSQDPEILMFNTTIITMTLFKNIKYNNCLVL